MDAETMKAVRAAGERFGRKVAREDAHVPATTVNLLDPAQKRAFDKAFARAFTAETARLLSARADGEEQK